MKKLMEGLAEFQQHVYPRHRELFEKLKKNQDPSTLFITCSDSRVVPNMILQADPGELFIIRTAGNMVPPYKAALGGGVAASIEYAVEALGIRTIVLCAHSDCGAMKAVLHPEKVASMPAVAEWVKHGELARRQFESELPQPEGVGSFGPDGPTERHTAAQAFGRLSLHPKTGGEPRNRAVWLVLPNRRRPDPRLG